MNPNNSSASAGGKATSLLRAEHQALEVHLDRLHTVIQAPRAARTRELRAAFLMAHPPLSAHYRREALLLACLDALIPEVARKMKAQHEEALELAAAVDHLLAGRAEAGDARSIEELKRLAHRFHAIAQHNIIEEERELFVLADRWLTTGQQDELAAAMLQQPSGG